MMKTVTLRKEQIYQGDLLLVNARHPYRDNSRKLYVSLNSRYEETLLSREAANALQFIFQKISSGNAIVPVSGYRTLEEQVNIYNTSLKDNGEEFTRKYVALPNHSEHQTGLAIDLGLGIFTGGFTACLPLVQVLLMSAPSLAVWMIFLSPALS